MLPAGLGVGIDPETYTRPPILELISRAGDVPEQEMAATFNMGLGFVAIVDEAPEGWLLVGEVTEGGGVDLGYASK
jgi:phosphoribosylformylglycinamidine cyclo-ligase